MRNHGAACNRPDSPMRPSRNINYVLEMGPIVILVCAEKIQSKRVEEVMKGIVGDG